MVQASLLFHVEQTVTLYFIFIIAIENKVNKSKNFQCPEYNII